MGPFTKLGTIDYGGDPATVLLGMFNLKEQTTYNLTQVGFKDPVLLSAEEVLRFNRNTAAAMMPRATHGSYGRRELVYNRIHISDVPPAYIYHDDILGMFGITWESEAENEAYIETVVSSVSLYDVLDLVSVATGCQITESDVENTAMPQPIKNAQGWIYPVVLTPLSTSLLFYSGEKIVLQPEGAGDFNFDYYEDLQRRKVDKDLDNAVVVQVTADPLTEPDEYTFIDKLLLPVGTGGINKANDLIQKRGLSISFATIKGWIQSKVYTVSSDVEIIYGLITGLTTTKTDKDLTNAVAAKVSTLEPSGTYDLIEALRIPVGIDGSVAQQEKGAFTTFKVIKDWINAIIVNPLKTSYDQQMSTVNNTLTSVSQAIAALELKTTTKVYYYSRGTFQAKANSIHVFTPDTPGNTCQLQIPNTFKEGDFVAICNMSGHSDWYLIFTGENFRGEANITIRMNGLKDSGIIRKTNSTIGWVRL